MTEWQRIRKHGTVVPMGQHVPAQSAFREAMRPRAGTFGALVFLAGLFAAAVLL